jgi:hypothetical protein
VRRIHRRARNQCAARDQRDQSVTGQRQAMLTFCTEAERLLARERRGNFGKRAEVELDHSARIAAASRVFDGGRAPHHAAVRERFA